MILRLSIYVETFDGDAELIKEGSEEEITQLLNHIHSPHGDEYKRENWETHLETYLEEFRRLTIRKFITKKEVLERLRK